MSFGEFHVEVDEARPPSWVAKYGTPSFLWMLVKHGLLGSRSAVLRQPRQLSRQQSQRLLMKARPPEFTECGEDWDGSEEEKYFCSMTRVEEECWAARRWSRKTMRIRAAWEVKLQEKIRDTKRCAAAAVPAGASAMAKAEVFKELHTILKHEEERGMKLITDELATLKLVFILSESKV